MVWLKLGRVSVMHVQHVMQGITVVGMAQYRQHAQYVLRERTALQDHPRLLIALVEHIVRLLDSLLYQRVSDA
jgi:hypothetical protein